MELSPIAFSNSVRKSKALRKTHWSAARSEFKPKLVNIGEEMLFLKYFSPPKSTSEELAKSGGLLKGNLR